MIEDKSPEEEIVIAPNGTKRILGQDAGSVVIADDFDAPLDPETMR
jgi:hypothetical protein